MKAIILDTSSILFGIENKIDVFDALRYSFPEYRIEVSSGIVSELKAMHGSKRKEKAGAGIALAMLERNNINVYKDNGKVDEWIARRAKQINALVCTNDIALKRGLKKSGIKAVSIGRGGRIR